jgi:pimeloyl-ACP methyl ester carboxylesterase
MSRVIAEDGVEIFYKDWGPKDAQPIVFHHGWPLSSDDWDGQMLFFLSKGYRVIAHDRRGHGRSSQVWDGHDMDHYAADASAVIQHLNLHNAIHIGHSTGGGEVARYVARHGEPQGRVAKAVLVSAVPPLMVKTDKKSRWPADRSLRRISQGAGRQSRAVLPRRADRPVLRLQPAGREGRPGRDLELVAPGHDGRGQGPL